MQVYMIEIGENSGLSASGWLGSGEIFFLAEH